MLMRTVSRNAVVAGAALIAATGVSKAAFAQTTTYCWIDAATGNPAPLGPPGWSSTGAGPNPYASNPDPNHVSYGGRNFVRVPCPPPAAPSTQTSWTGPFIGGQLAGSWSRVGTNEFDAFTGLHTNAFNDNGGSFGGGVNFGYNWQPWGNNVVVGFVLDGTFMNDRVVHTFPYNANSIASTINSTGSLQARAGFLATPSLLLYGQTGVSVAGQRLQINFAGGYPTDASVTTPGYTLGGGAEWMLPVSPLAFGAIPSFFVAYEHTWWDTASLYRPAASSGFNYMWQRESDAVKGGVRLRFAP